MTNRITYSSWQKNAVYERYEGKCGICGKSLSRKNMTIAHKIPLTKGGDNSIDNLILSCWECNHIKNNLTFDDFFDKLLEIFRYNKDTIMDKINMI